MSRRPSAWRLVSTGARSGRWNMACDAELLERIGDGESPPTLRFFGWDPVAVSLGFNQPPPDPAAAAALAALGADWVRRPTGGRAVWHGPPERELTYSVVAPLGEPPLAGGLVGAYRTIHGALAEGLRRLGVDARLAEPRRRARSPAPSARVACFAASVPGEIVADGRKLVGSAQRRSRRALLQHGSIPLAGNQDALSVVWPGSFDPSTATTVAAAAGRDVAFAAVASVLAEALAGALGLRLVPGALTAREERTIALRTEAGTALDTVERRGRYSHSSPP